MAQGLVPGSPLNPPHHTCSQFFFLFCDYFLSCSPVLSNSISKWHLGSGPDLQPHLQRTLRRSAALLLLGVSTLAAARAGTAQEKSPSGHFSSALLLSCGGADGWRCGIPLLQAHKSHGGVRKGSWCSPGVIPSPSSPQLEQGWAQTSPLCSQFRTWLWAPALSCDEHWGTVTLLGSMGRAAHEASGCAGTETLQNPWGAEPWLCLAGQVCSDTPGPLPGLVARSCSIPRSCFPATSTTAHP